MKTANPALAPGLNPAGAIAALLRVLVQYVVTQDIMRRLPAPVMAYIINRIRATDQGIARLQARLQAGTFAPRRVTPRRTPSGSRPGRPRPFPLRFGWLRPLVPGMLGASGHLEALLRQPDMVALMQAAPAQVARLLRPICWMLRVTPPPILTRPRRAPAPPPEIATQTAEQIVPGTAETADPAPCPPARRPPAPRQPFPARLVPRARGQPHPA